MSDRQEQKEKAVAYYQKNGVPMHMQEVLNVMFEVNPSDANGYVSTFFEELAIAPTLTRALAVKSLDNKGQSSLTTKLYCLVRNKERMVGESHACVDTEILENARAEDKEAEDITRDQEINQAIVLLNNDFRDVILSSNPKHQQELDDKIYDLIENRRIAAEQEDKCKEPVETPPQLAVDDGKKAKKSGKGSAKKKGGQVIIIPDKPKEKSYPGWNSVTALSQAVCIAGASLAGTSVFDHLICCYGGDDNEISLPLPVISLLQSGKAALGKSNCIKEYMIVPRCDLPLSEAIPAATKFHESIMKSLYAKGGVSVKNLNDFGVLCPALDKPEQGMDMVIEAVTQQGYEMGKDFFFILNASAHECFDYDKGKYEVVAGLAKSGDELAEFWADLCTRYPAVIGIIDPIRPEETEQWNKICSAISDRCLVIADKAYERPGLLKNEDLNFYEFATSGVVMRLKDCNTISHIMECAKKMSDINNTVMLASGQHEMNDTTIIDVAIASRSRFVKLGGLSRGERLSKFNRLMELEEELGERKAELKPLDFPVIPPKLPTPTPEPENEPTADDN